MGWWGVAGGGGGGGGGGGERKLAEIKGGCTGKSEGPMDL